MNCYHSALTGVCRITDINGYDAWFVNICKRPRGLQHEYKTYGKNNIVYHFTKLST